MVASGCQDNFIRIWKIDASNLFDEHSFDCTSFVSLETVIVGHEDKIYCVKWIKSCSNKENEILQLLSTSIDRSAIVWEQPDDVNSNVWLEKHRFGEISGNNLGFLSGEVSPNGVHLIINSYNGALHAWKRDEFERWQRDVVIGGHSGEINGLAWSPDGSYLISGASDCSTRIHCEWARTGTWHEVTRAQVHGYEVNCLAPLSSTLFASGADEKVIRVFQATKYFLQCYHNVSGQSLKVNASEETDLPDFATIPLLGLSNKAVFDSKDSADATNATRPFIQEPPTEEALLQHTCWSEHAKLYGHGYELFALASSHDGKLLASACKATNHTDASICLWNRARNFDLIEHLAFHRLTVTKLTFSPDDSLLLSVSRDRSWQLFRIETDASDQVSIRSVTEQDLKSRMLHSRVIRDACWMPDNLHFITVSRDQSAIVWRIDEKNESIDSEKSPSCMVKDLEHRFKADHAINCCDISKHWTRDGKHLIALGLESGDLLLTCFDFDDGWCIMRRFDRLHTLAIKQVRFSPTNPHKVATGGADAYVQIISIK